MAFENLNSILIEDDECGRVQQDYSSVNYQVEVYFKNLEEHLIKRIREADSVFGCVAWLTSERILQALLKKSTSIVVQKEDLWRPDLDAERNLNWKEKLRTQYNSIQTKYCRHDLPGPGLSISGDPTIEGVRCVGYYNRERKPASPRMHHKFLVFTKEGPPREEDHYDGEDCGRPGRPMPYAVWTGSFNFTYNSTQSFENAVYINDDCIASSYFDEYQQILALSEPLDWESDWCAPEWRIGT
jgi:hypothetical protein